MTTPEARSTGHQLATRLTQAVARALAPAAPPDAFSAARDASQLLSLPGLDRVLEALAPHAGARWPRELGPVIGRLERVTEEASRSGDLEPFRRADRELSGLAAEVEAIEWSAGGSGAVATIGAVDVLGDLPLEPLESLRDVRLLPEVAAGLRAALDWLVGDGGPRRPLRVTVEDGVLQVRCESVQLGGLRAAQDVIAAVGGNLAPVTPAREAAAAPGGMRVRIPTFAPRPSYLMIHQGGIPIALPWHAVLRVHASGAAELEARDREGAGVALLAPFAPSPASREARPVILIAHGLKRAYLVADCLVWRLAAEACAAPGPAPAPGLEHAVRTEEGEIYRLADPAVLLANVALPPLPEARAAQRPPSPASPRTPAAPLGPTVSSPAGVPGRAAAGRAPVRDGAAAATRTTPQLRVLEAEDVEALALEVATAPSSVGPVAGPQALAAVAESKPSNAADARAPRRALLADDSLTARMFLARMLEQHGFEVTAVSRGAELLAALARGPWSLLCVDVELPDMAGVPLLREVAARARAPLVALVRDRQDLETANAAGISRVLLKPFDPDALTQLVRRLVPERGAR